MQILFGKTNWECPELSLDEFAVRAVADGFDALELYVPNLTVSPNEIAALVERHHVGLIADIVTEGHSINEHLESLERQIQYALDAGAPLINAHTGRDIFSFADNVRLFERSLAISEESGIPIAHETHRSRALYSAVDTRRYLEELPSLRINADFSHWMNVHESDLRDQMDNVDLAIERSIHIHARVGHEQGPQVNDPRAPEWVAHVENHSNLWKRIVLARQVEGMPHFTITPEFGPHPYMPSKPHTQQPSSDTWEVNVFMKDHLSKIFSNAE